MSDKLKTLFPIKGTFSEGEQPVAQKFTVLHELARIGFQTIERFLGDGRGSESYDNPGPYVKNINRHLNDEDYVEFTAASGIVNLSKAIGSLGYINPSFISNQTSMRLDQSEGWPLVPKRIQQLPFRPIDNTDSSTFLFSGGSFTNMVSAPEDVIKAGDWHVTSNGVLYCYTIPTSATVRYDLKTDQGDTYYGAAYNVIPDPSIYGLNDGSGNLAARLSRTGGAVYGSPVIELIEESGPDSYRYRVLLPEIISSQESITNGTVSINHFEPVGKIDADKRRKYVLNSDLYGSSGTYVDDSGLITIGSIVLAYKNNNITYAYDDLVWEKGDDEFTYYFYVSEQTHRYWENDSGGLLKSGGINSKDFSLYTVGTQIATLLAQLRNDMRNHSHSGIGSSKISHKDLSDAYGLNPGLNSSFTLDGKDRVLLSSQVEDNVHPQYLHRLGFRHGGTAGKYYEYEDGSPSSGISLSDLNMFMGDMVLGPVSYVNSSGVVTTGFSWETDQSSLPEHIAKSDTFSLIFGQPLSDPDMYGEGLGATRLNYVANIKEESDYPLYYDMSKHGLALGDLSSGQTEENRKRGLRISWGNLFFGMNEDEDGGLHDEAHDLYYLDNYETYPKRGASLTVSEFNVVASANKQAGNNTNSDFREVPGRDGIVLRGTKGAGVSISVGASSAASSRASSENIDNVPGMISITGENSWKNLLSENETWLEALEDTIGSFVFASSRPGTTGKMPWYKADGTFFGLLNQQLTHEHNADGGFLYMGAFSPSYLLGDGTIDSRGNESVLGTYSKPWGKVVLGATYGIDFFVCSGQEDGRLEELELIGSGFTKAGNQTNIGFNVSDSGSFQYRHKELRLWGAPYVEDENEQAELFSPIAGNINFMTYYNSPYNRFGFDIDWSEDTSPDGAKANDSAMWMNGRLEALGERSADRNGHIRSAKTIEAWKGIRHDPTQPYVVTYVIPFKYRHIWTGADYLTALANGTRGAGELIDHNDPYWEYIIPGAFPIEYAQTNSDFHLILEDGHMSLSGAANTVNTGWPRIAGENQDEVRTTIDQIIRWHDSELAYTQGLSTAKPGMSLIDIDVDMDLYSCWSINDGYITAVPMTDDEDVSGHVTYGNLFDKCLISSNPVLMLNLRDVTDLGFAEELDLAELNSCFLPFRKKGNARQLEEAQTGNVIYDVEYQQNIIHPYRFTLGMFLTEDTASGESNYFHWNEYLTKFDVNYDTYVRRLQWGLNLSGDFPADRSPVEAFAGSWPFRIYQESGEPALEINGWITLKLIGHSRSYGQMSYTT